MNNEERDTLIREHGERIATLTARIDSLQRDLDRLENRIETGLTRRSMLWFALIGWLIALINVVATVGASLVPEVLKRLRSR